jgi:hypothetical protein
MMIVTLTKKKALASFFETMMGVLSQQKPNAVTFLLCTLGSFVGVLASNRGRAGSRPVRFLLDLIPAFSFPL